MEVSRIIGEIDAQISKLQQARELLAGTTANASNGPGRPKGSNGPGRPKGSKNSKRAAVTAGKRRTKLTAEGRKSISDAMKRRWAERRKQAGKSAAASK